MPHDPVRVDDTKAWLVKANQDLHGAQVDLAATTALVEDALFHCQQAVEKAWKAFLTWHDRPFRRTHDLKELGSLCAQLDSTLETLSDRASPLSAYAWRFRYPGAHARPTLEQAQETHALARDVVETVVSRLPAEVRP